MESFSKNQVISRFGNLSLYSFITANMSKEDFIEMSSEMALQILNSKTLTKLKKCKIGCIDAKEHILPSGIRNSRTGTMEIKSVTLGRNSRNP